MLFSFCLLLPFLASPIEADRAELGRRLQAFTQPPAEFRGQRGDYRSPLLFADGSPVKSAADWPRRRQEIVDTWHRRLGGKPSLLKNPVWHRREPIRQQGYSQQQVRLQVAADDLVVEGYLLIPEGKGPFPAVLVPFYEARTSIGQGQEGKGSHDYGLQLVRRGFVTLSIGTPGPAAKVGGDTRVLLTAIGKHSRRQPMRCLASSVWPVVVVMYASASVARRLRTLTRWVVHPPGFPPAFAGLADQNGPLRG